MSKNFKDKIISRKLIQLIIPAFGTSIAISLNEFVDSLVVAQLLGSEAMAVVNIGVPIVLFESFIYSLFGTGGCLFYAKAIAEKKGERAACVIKAVLRLAVLCGLVIMALGLIFRRPLANLMASGSSFANDFYSYSLFLYILSPIFCFVMTLSYILPAMNYPVQGCLCVIISNVVNLVMDLVLIRGAGMGIEGASAATMIAYCVTLLYLGLMYKLGKIEFPIKNDKKTKLGTDIKEVIRKGLSEAGLQLGYSLAWGICNRLAIRCGGDSGLVAFTFFMQLWSIISIFIAGISGGSIPLLAFVFGAKDYRGYKALARKTVAALIFTSLFLIIILITFPQTVFSMFSITDPLQVALCRNALIAFSVTAPFEGLLLHYSDILNSVEKEIYSTIINVTNSFAGVVVFSFVGIMIWGIDGLWYAHVINNFFMILGIAVANMILYRKSNKTISPVFLFMKNDTEVIMDDTIISDEVAMTKLSEKLIVMCDERNVSHNISLSTGLMLEEMAIYTWKHCGKEQFIDILVRRHGQEMEIAFRSIGKPFNPLMEYEKEDFFNVEFIQTISHQITYEYALGMNTTTITL